MRRLTIIGIVLIILGVVGFVYPRITYTKNRTSVDVGPVQFHAEQKKTVTIPDIASGATPSGWAPFSPSWSRRGGADEALAAWDAALAGAAFATVPGQA